LSGVSIQTGSFSAEIAVAL